MSMEENSPRLTKVRMHGHCNSEGCLIAGTALCALQLFQSTVQRRLGVV